MTVNTNQMEHIQKLEKKLGVDHKINALNAIAFCVCDFAIFSAKVQSIIAVDI